MTRLFRRRPRRPFRALALFAALAPALPALGGPAVDLERLGLSKSEIAAIARDPAASLRRYYQTVLSLSPDGVVTRQLVETQNRVTQARLRGSQIGAVLGYDLNGDGAVGMDEIAQVLAIQSGTRNADLLILRDTADSNGDGRIDMAEIRAYVARGSSANLGLALNARRYEGVLKLDVDGDGRVTLEEIHAVVTAVEAQRGGGKPPVPPTKL